MQQSKLKEPYFYGNQRHISFLTITLNAIQASKIPLYSSKFSRKDFNQHQLLSLVIFKQYLGLRYRDFIELVELMDVINKRLGISRIPHYSTLCKFSARISSILLLKIYKEVMRIFYHDTMRISTMAIDSTGFPIEHFSYYYSLRTEKTRKDYIKVSIAVDTAKQAILGYKITKSRQHDTKHAKPLLRKTMKRALCYVLDRGYDSEPIHCQIRSELKAKSLIPLRNWNADYVKGVFRNEMLTDFDKKRYGQRNKVETVFSVLKRRFGDEITARLFRNQVKEVKIKCIVHSVDRFLKIQRIFIVD